MAILEEISENLQHGKASAADVAVTFCEQNVC